MNESIDVFICKTKVAFSRGRSIIEFVLTRHLFRTNYSVLSTMVLRFYESRFASTLLSNFKRYDSRFLVDRSHMSLELVRTLCRIATPKWPSHLCRSILNLWIITFLASLISPLDWSLKSVNIIAHRTTFIKCNAEREFELRKSDSSLYVNVIYYMLYRCITMIESVQTTVWNLILLLSKGRPDYLTRYN